MIVGETGIARVDRGTGNFTLLYKAQGVRISGLRVGADLRGGRARLFFLEEVTAGTDRGTQCLRSLDRPLGPQPDSSEVIQQWARPQVAPSDIAAIGPDQLDLGPGRCLGAATARRGKVDL